MTICSFDPGKSGAAPRGGSAGWGDEARMRSGVGGAWAMGIPVLLTGR
jgi:hypothetical protein